MATAAVANRVRILGAGLTLFTFGGQPIAFCEQVRHQSPRPVAQFSVVQPMDEPYASEILVSPAAGPGTLVLNLYELFGSGGKASKIWDRLGVSLGTQGNPFGGSTQFNTSQFLSNLTPGTGIFSGAVDIVDIFIRQALADPTKLQIVKIVRPLTASASTATQYTEEYNGCTIVDVVDGEEVAVGTLEIAKQITVMYRYATRDSRTSQAFALRDGQQVSIQPGVV